MMLARSLFLLCVGHTVGVQPRGRLGEKLGRLLFESAEKGPFAEKDAQQEAMRKRLQPEALVNDQVAEVVARANERAAREVQLDSDDGSAACQPNYTYVCPETWTLRPSGACHAPASYRGPCARIQPSGLNLMDKSKLEKQCDVAWPCVGVCAHDFHSCPSGWHVKNATGVCELEIDSVNWSGSPACAAAYDFRLMSVGEKQLLMKRCGLSWPCAQVECQEDYSAVCPDGWVSLDGVCLAQVDFPAKPGCEFAINATAWSAAEKLVFAQQCDVSWGCSAGLKTTVAKAETRPVPLLDGPVALDGTVIANSGADVKSQEIAIPFKDSAIISGPVDEDGDVRF